MSEPSTPTPTVPAPLPTAVEKAVGLTAEDIAKIEAMSMADIEREIQALRSANPRAMSDADVERAVVLHRVAVRKSSGPPKPKTAPNKTEMTAADLDAALGL